MNGKKILLVNQMIMPHYRIPVYSYLSKYLKKNNMRLVVIAEKYQKNGCVKIDFNYQNIKLNTKNIVKFIKKNNIDAVIFWVNLKNLYLFPTIIIAKYILNKKILYWGHGIDAEDVNNNIKNFFYRLEMSLCDGVILYSSNLKKYVSCANKNKIFIANNTICINEKNLKLRNEKILKKYNIATQKNIIFVGRIEKRKRIENLINAHKYLIDKDIGLIIAGPDPENLLRNYESKYLYKLGPIYGQDKYDLLLVSNVYCLPGHVGLGIVDAMYCGLPFITEEGDLSAEIMYLKDGLNGFIVPKGETKKLANKIKKILTDHNLNEKFSIAAKKEIMKNGHINKMCEAFCKALEYTFK